MPLLHTCSAAVDDREAAVVRCVVAEWACIFQEKVTTLSVFVQQLATLCKKSTPVSDGYERPSDHTTCVQNFGVSDTTISSTKKGTQIVLQERAGFAGSRTEQSFQ